MSRLWRASLVCVTPPTVWTAFQCFAGVPSAAASSLTGDASCALTFRLDVSADATAMVEASLDRAGLPAEPHRGRDRIGGDRSGRVQRELRLRSIHAHRTGGEVQDRVAVRS